jgi:hypothetical protein
MTHFLCFLSFRFFDRDGGRLVVDSSSLELVKGATVDYKQVRLVWICAWKWLVPRSKRAVPSSL